MFAASSALSDPEITISKYIENYIDAGKPLGWYIVRHFGNSMSAFVALRRIPRYKMIFSDQAEGIAIRAMMLRHSSLSRMTGLITAALSLPYEPGQYSIGASKSRIRSKVRRARRFGVSWAAVNDRQDRRYLLKLANERELAHPNIAYRSSNPDNRDLLEYRHWLVALSADGRPLLLCVALVDGELALLRYFRTLGSGPEYTTARYYMMEVLVDQLVGLGVRRLFDDVNPFQLNNGLRHFQREVGFRIARFYISRRPSTRVGRVLSVGSGEHPLNSAAG